MSFKIFFYEELRKFLCFPRQFPKSVHYYESGYSYWSWSQKIATESFELLIWGIYSALESFLTWLIFFFFPNLKQTREIFYLIFIQNLNGILSSVNSNKWTKCWELLKHVSCTARWIQLKKDNEENSKTQPLCLYAWVGIVLKKSRWLFTLNNIILLSPY